jgi:hypothetical protein
MKPRPLPSTSFPIHYSLLTAPFEALRPEIAWLKKDKKNPQSRRKQRKVCYFHLPFPSMDSSVSIVTTLRGATGPRRFQFPIPGDLTPTSDLNLVPRLRMHGATPPGVMFCSSTNTSSFPRLHVRHRADYHSGNAPDSYSGSTWFESCQGHWLSCLRNFSVILS